MIDSAKRLPFSTKQQFLKYLPSRFGHTNEPSFQSLFKFVSPEEKCKPFDFGILLLSDRDEACGAKKSLKNKFLSNKHWLDRLIRVNSHQKTIEGVLLIYSQIDRIQLKLVQRHQFAFFLVLKDVKNVIG